MPVPMMVPSPVKLSSNYHTKDPNIQAHPDGSVDQFRSYMGEWKSRKSNHALAVFNGSWPRNEYRNGFTA